MAFKQVQDLDSEYTIALGGVDKNGKQNPKSVEGYYLGKRKVESAMAKSGFANLHFFQTEDGNIGVWGKTNLDQKLANVTPGTMVRATHTGMQRIPGKRDMFKYSVEVDDDNTIQINLSSSSESSVDDSSPMDADDSLDADDDLGADDTPADEIPPARAKPPVRAAQPPSKEQQAKVKGLLGQRKTASS